MFLTNNTKFNASYSVGFAKDGRRMLVVITKATYQIINSVDKDLPIHAEQQPIIQADVSTAEPGYSATLHETDYSTFKPRCDIIFNGCAYVPHDEFATKVDVSLQVKGHMSKTFRVIGDRTWKNSRPTKFNKMPITYDNAFGGVDNTDLVNLKIYMPNPVGTGYSYHKNNIGDMALPNTEELNNPITQPNGRYSPMSFGPIGRAWPVRVDYAGTYDQKWVENTMPFYPDDFDYLFFQCVPLDQQIPYVNGGEEVQLVNLSQHGNLTFCLPKQAIPVTTINKEGAITQYHSNVDTVIIEPEFEHIMMVSRAAIPLANDLHELEEVIVGQTSRKLFHLYRKPSKRFYQNLSEFVATEKNKRK